MKFLIIRDVDNYEQTPRFEFYGSQLRNERVCDCCKLGPFDPGCLQDLNKLERPIFSIPTGLGVSKIVGRSLNINNVIRLLNENRLVSILGNIGIGKGKVAMSVALRLQERNRFKDGVLHVSMKSQEFSEALIDGIIKALKMAEQLQSPSLARPDSDGSLSGQRQRQLLQITQCLEHRKVLILIDRIQDALAMDAATFKHIIGKILMACPGVKILVTSIYPMHSLAVGNLAIQETIHKVQELSGAESAKLFLKYARLNLENPEVAQKVSQFLGQEVLGTAQLLDSFKQHEMIRKMKGHPTVIILHASMTKQNYSLDQIYAMLSSSSF
jgi:hypothetical protein